MSNPGISLPNNETIKAIIMKTTYIKHLTAVAILLLTFPLAQAQYFPSGGYQGGALGSGGDEILVVGVAENLPVAQAEALVVYPNPFMHNTTIHFALASAANCDMRLFDLDGRLMKVFLKSTLINVGEHSISWDGSDKGGNKLSRGIYYLKFTAGDKTTVRKVVIL